MTSPDSSQGGAPFKETQRGIDAGGAFNNHNVEKLGVTINLRHERGRNLFRRLVATSDVVAESFAAGVMARLGFSYEELQAIRPNVAYVSSSGFGATGPYSSFESWGPVVQASRGLTSRSGLPDQLPAGIGYSYMEWIDMSCTDAGAALRSRAHGRGRWGMPHAPSTATAAIRHRWPLTATTPPPGTTTGWPSCAATTLTGRGCVR